jgi:predicted nucleic acid-binding protein
VIVVDSNIIAYCWINGPHTDLARRVRVKDPDWHVPILWRSEMRSILAGYLRDGSLAARQATSIMNAAEIALAGSEHLVPSSSVFDIVGMSRLSAYDCECVALASMLMAALVTSDRP